jgi:hypothetical protein
MPERLQEFEQVAIEGLKEIKQEFKETIHLKAGDRTAKSDPPEAEVSKDRH